MAIQEDLAAELRRLGWARAVLWLHGGRGRVKKLQVNQDGMVSHWVNGVLIRGVVVDWLLDGWELGDLTDASGKVREAPSLAFVKSCAAASGLGLHGRPRNGNGHK